MKFSNILSTSKKVSNWGPVTTFHFIVTFIVTYPSILSLKSYFIGGPRGDKFQFIWNFWWAKYSLFDLHQLPFFCNMQYYPTGVSLALHDTSYFWSFISIPFQIFFDPGIILNIFLILCFPLNGLAFYHLANEITKEHRGALVGSLIFAYCPYLIGRFHVCHIQYLGVFFIPLFLLELWRYNQSSHLCNIIKIGIYFIFTSLISYYYGLALFMVFFSFSIYKIILTVKVKRYFPYQFKRFYYHLIIISIFFVISLSPFVTPILIQMKRGDYQLAKESLNNVEDNSADIIAYFIPDTTLAYWRGWSLSEKWAGWSSRFNASLSGNKLEKSVYPGWVSLFAIGIACFSTSIRKQTWPWLMFIFFFWIISLGPTLFINGNPHLQGLLPYHIFTIIPIFDIMRAPTRFAFFITLGSGMLAAIGIKRLREKVNIRVFRIITILITIIILVEFLPTQTYLTPNNIFISNFYYNLQKDSNKLSVLNIPVDFTAATGGGDIYVYTQTIHEKPIIGGYVSREPAYALDTLNRSSFLLAITPSTHDETSMLPLTEAGYKEMPDALKRFNIGHVILHKSLLTYDEFRRVIEWIEPTLGRPIFEDEWIRVYSTLLLIHEAD